MINPVIGYTTPDKFSPEIQACIQNIQDKFYLIDTPKIHRYKPYCEQLMTYASEEQSDYLFALSYYSLMHYYAADDNHIEAVRCALDGIKYQQKAHEYMFVARSYNILGVYTESMGDSSKAVDYLLSSIDICDQHQLDYVHGLAAANLADIFHRTNNDERALFYYDEAIKFTLRENNTPASDVIEVLTCTLCSKGYCLLSSGKIQDAIACADMIGSYLAQLNEQHFSYDAFVIHTYFATLEFEMGHIDECRRQMDISTSALQKISNYTAYADDIHAYIQLAKKLDTISDLIVLLDAFIAQAEAVQATFYLFRFLLEERIECARKIHDESALIQYSLQLFQLYQSQNAQMCKEALRAEQIHHENQLIQKQHYELLHINQKLLSKSQHDTLTGLPNRAYLNDYAEDTFSKAFKCGQAIGVEILDIDNFKTINDTYGHLEGDRYLSTLSELLQRTVFEFQDVFAARYGGDEFVIIYLNKTNDEIRNIMNGLREAVHTILLPETPPGNQTHLTISQGCFNRIPQGGNRLWDFLARADATLYEVKKTGKNNYKLRDTFR